MNKFSLQLGTLCAPSDSTDPSSTWIVDKMMDSPNLVRARELYDSSKSEIFRVNEVVCGFKPGMRVEEHDVVGGASRGVGTIIQIKPTPTQPLAIVDFESGIYSLPWWRLRYVPSAQGDAERGIVCDKADALDRARARLLAELVRDWHRSTHQASNVDIDPLPHQLSTVEGIIASGHYNWMIADDVGLGKTIQIGLLIRHLLETKPHARVLVVTPASLTAQWQHELHARFGLLSFRRVGEDVTLGRTNPCSSYPQLIASMDTLKSKKHMKLMDEQRAVFDLVVIDEAHKLTRTEQGTRQRSSHRYVLAKFLRDRTENMLLATATPHQGKTDMFCALLELLRPASSDEFALVSPELLSEMIYRNRKHDALDWDGRPLFRGQTTELVESTPSPEELAFDELLIDYLERGYKAAEGSGDVGRTIGFVMSVFRKLAASSLPAILASLRKRRDRLSLEPDTASKRRRKSSRSPSLEELDPNEQVERADELELGVFFESEVALLESLLELGEELEEHADTKLTMFLEELAPTLLEHDKLLVFTEFRTTQAHLVEGLARTLGADAVVQIHGGMSQQDRRDALEAFEHQARVMVSTEAGGEGLNMHRCCHTLINFDLPWNPMRLVQRAGRLNRYGQEHDVRVINLARKGTFDDEIQKIMRLRLDQIVRDLAPLDDQENPGAHESILGQLVGLIDLQGTMSKAITEGRAATDEALTSSLEAARDRYKNVHELLGHARHHQEFRRCADSSIDRAALARLLETMLEIDRVRISARSHGGRVLQVTPTKKIRGWLDAPKASAVNLTVYPECSSRRVHLLGTEHPMLADLFERATHPAFGARFLQVCTDDPTSRGHTLVLARLEFKDINGYASRSQLVSVVLTPDGDAEVDRPGVHKWLERATRKDEEVAKKLNAEELAMIQDALHQVATKRADLSLQAMPLLMLVRFVQER